MASRAVHRKKDGRAYVYSVESYWDKEKKAPRNKQVCLGRLDEATVEVIPIGTNLILQLQLQFSFLDPLFNQK